MTSPPVDPKPPRSLWSGWVALYWAPVSVVVGGVLACVLAVVGVPMLFGQSKGPGWVPSSGDVSSPRPVASPSVTAPVVESPEVFVRRWFDTENQAAETQNVELLTPLYLPSCMLCAKVAKQLQGLFVNGQRLEGKNWQNVRVTRQYRYPNRTVGVAVLADNMESRLLRPDGSVVSVDPTLRNVRLDFLLKPTGDTWKVITYESLGAQG
jgi:hypothetical protein